MPSHDHQNAIDMLMAQHRNVEQLIDAVESGDGLAKEAAFIELADALAIHTAIEERIFYPSVKGRETEELLAESVEEHLAMKRTLADLMRESAGSENFDPKMAALKEHVQHHAFVEEEGKLFPLLRALFTDTELSAIGDQMNVLMAQLREADKPPRDAIPDETGEAAHI